MDDAVKRVVAARVRNVLVNSVATDIYASPIGSLEVTPYTDLVTGIKVKTEAGWRYFEVRVSEKLEGR